MHEHASIELKTSLWQAAFLAATPDYKKLLYLDVAVTDCMVYGVLFQKKVVYLSDVNTRWP